jgi:hypothetical protein
MFNDAAESSGMLTEELTDITEFTAALKKIFRCERAKIDYLLGLSSIP